MTRGVLPKPRALKLLHGDRKDRINDNEPIPRDVLPVCPDEASPEAREIWDYTLNELVAMRTAAAVDRDALYAYCCAVVTHRAAVKLVDQTGLLMKGAKGVPVKNPAVGMARDAANNIRVFAHEFGLTPSARTRIEVDRRATSAAIDNPFAVSS